MLVPDVGELFLYLVLYNVTSDLLDTGALRFAGRRSVGRLRTGGRFWTPGNSGATLGGTLLNTRIKIRGNL